MTTTDDGELAREISARCFGREALIEPLGGSNNAVFRLRFADGVHILKLARSSEARPLRKEHMLLDLLAATAWSTASTSVRAATRNAVAMATTPWSATATRRWHCWATVAWLPPEPSA